MFILALLVVEGVGANLDVLHWATLNKLWQVHKGDTLK